MARGVEVPSEGTLLLRMAPQTCRSWSPAEKVAFERLGRIHLCRAPPMNFKESLGPWVDSMDYVLAYFRKIAKGTDNDLSRGLAQGREYICGTVRNLFRSHAPATKGSRPPKMFPGATTRTWNNYSAASRREGCWKSETQRFARSRFALQLPDDVLVASRKGSQSGAGCVRGPRPEPIYCG